MCLTYREKLQRCAIKLALEEWRHWVEGSEEPFIVCTDHKNLAFLTEHANQELKSALL